MIARPIAALCAIVCCCGRLLGADPYAIKTTKVEPPKTIHKDVLAQLDENAVQFRDAKGDLLAEVWFRKSFEVKASEDAIKKGVTLQQLPMTVVLGAIRIHKKIGDYRKQKPKPGTYLMRLAFQPMDGDHMGTAPIGSFALLTPVATDKGEAKLDMEKLVELSSKAAGTEHPCIWLLLPPGKGDAEAKPTLKKKIESYWVIFVQRDVTIQGVKKGTIGFGLTLIGFSSVA